MQKGNLTVEDYIKSLLARIKERDQIVQAWAYLNPDFVLDRARKLGLIPPNQRGSLHSIPIGVKDIILTNGTPSSHLLMSLLTIYIQIDMPTGYNSTIYISNPPILVDAALITTLRAATVVIFGKNNNHGARC
jgi:Asp-tRNA(Asn)/Glu-tRNA(Gln) amidotransferase A subunit family amidase